MKKIELDELQVLFNLHYVVEQQGPRRVIVKPYQKDFDPVYYEIEGVWREAEGYGCCVFEARKDLAKQMSNTKLLFGDWYEGTTIDFNLTDYEVIA